MAKELAVPAKPMYEMNQAIVAADGETLNQRLHCGLCACLCPWTKVDSPFVVCQLIRLLIKAHEAQYRPTQSADDG